MRGEHPVHFVAQRRIALARLVEELLAGIGIAAERGVENVGDLPPALRRHAPPSSLNSHARAACQSRIVVAREVPIRRILGDLGLPTEVPAARPWRAPPLTFDEGNGVDPYAADVDPP